MIIERTLTRAAHRLEDVRDAMAAVYARASAGDAESIQNASDMLTMRVDNAQRACLPVQRLIQRLRAADMSDAASILCQGGRRDAARMMMRVHTLTAGMASAQTDVATFIQECLSALGATQESTQHQARGGRFLGSA